MFRRAAVGLEQPRVLVDLSGLAGFMKSFELIVIAARETDVVRVRTSIRRETVRRYRLVMTPAMGDVTGHDHVVDASPEQLLDDPLRDRMATSAASEVEIGEMSQRA